MPEDKASLLNIVNASGFLFQIRVKKELERLNYERSSPWSVVASEVRWIDPSNDSEQFIDMVLQSSAGKMVVETKRVIDGEWIFLIGDGATNMSRA